MTPGTARSIVAAGACSPLGLTAAATAAEVAAGTSRFADTDCGGQLGNPARACAVELLPATAALADRSTALAVTALADCTDGHRFEHDVPLVLAVPDGLGEGGRAALVDALQARVPSARLARDGLVSGGRACWFEALARATRLAGEGGVRRVLVGAVDSWCTPDRLRSLAAEGRLLSSENGDGLVAGEGAAFLLLSGDDAHAGAHLSGLAQSRDPQPFVADGPHRAEGLTQAFRALRADPAAGQGRVDRVIGAQTGESHWAREFSYAYLRNAALMPEPCIYEISGPWFGDAGAAAPALVAATVFAAHRHGVPLQQPRRELIYATADDGSVGACVLQFEATPPR